MIINKVFASILTVILTRWAFDPKYRYNDHLKWKPDGGEIAAMLLYITIILWAIWT